MIKGLVSVVVPLYNYTHYIEDLIKSVQRQTYDQWELIIVDDCSLDNPISVIKKYLNCQIRYIRLKKNKGYATAKNEGIIKSSGEFIVVLDADDVLTDSSLAVRVKFLHHNPKFKWVHAKAYEFKHDIDHKWWVRRRFIRRFEKIRKTNNYSKVWDSVHAQTVMVKRNVYYKVGLYEETMKSMSDKEMWARIQFNVGIPGYINKFVSYYRMHAQQMHRSKIKQKMVKRLTRQLKNFIKIRQKGNFKRVRKMEK